MKINRLLLIFVIFLSIVSIRLIKDKQQHLDSIPFLSSTLIEVEEKECYTQEEVKEYIFKALNKR